MAPPGETGNHEVPKSPEVLKAQKFLNFHFSDVRAEKVTPEMIHNKFVQQEKEINDIYDKRDKAAKEQVQNSNLSPTQKEERLRTIKAKDDELRQLVLRSEKDWEQKCLGELRTLQDALQAEKAAKERQSALDTIKKIKALAKTDKAQDDKEKRFDLFKTTIHDFPAMKQFADKIDQYVQDPHYYEPPTQQQLERAYQVEDNLMKYEEEKFMKEHTPRENQEYDHNIFAPMGDALDHYKSVLSQRLAQAQELVKAREKLDEVTGNPWKLGKASAKSRAEWEKWYYDQDLQPDGDPPPEYGGL